MSKVQRRSFDQNLAGGARLNDSIDQMKAVFNRLVIAAMIASHIGIVPIAAQALQTANAGAPAKPAGPTLVELTLKDGRKISGRIVNVEAGAVTLADAKIATGTFVAEPGNRATLQPSDVSHAKLLTRYTASGDASDAATARYVIALLGANKEIELTTSSRRLRTVIRSIEPDSFTIAQEERRATEQIAYGDVRQVGPTRMRTGAKAALYIAIGFGAYLGISLLNYLTCGCG